MTYQKKGNFRADGPRNSQGFGHDWQIHNAIMRLSHAAKYHRDQADMLWAFLVAHPEIKDDIRQRWEAGNIPAEKLISVIVDVKQRLDREKANRDRVAKEHRK